MSTRALLSLLVAVSVSGCAPATTRSGSTTPPATPTQSRTSCASGGIPVDAALREPKDIRLKVTNASGTEGLALTVFVELGQRGFQMLGTAEGTVAPVPQVAVIRYGPRTVGAAWLVKLYFDGDVTTEYDARRGDDIVEIVLGQGYTQIRTITEVNQAVAAADPPTMPPGGCVLPT